ncbi:pyridoxine 5'-phosphate synthase [candidate division LCP-89 bacterium B3_LCP]|uniref:Pyridoxine 5'-phosphate synthase n=1 Tax=candidate division LCP-89 bacterium B3_LCP TaxID=2012998 RepID=A0A532V493_UNCL8|nr:MAG: pyridoxine 5'-phosphate synthase [candidate division LCP-89 bacterium B3_LCP]
MKLGINIDHIATLRQARGGSEPDPVGAAMIADLAGADSIVCHLREDRRHIQDRDLELIRQVIHSRLNMEMATTQEMIEKALMVKPEIVTLVPEKREERTTESGLNLAGNLQKYKDAVLTLNSSNIEVSLFIDPTMEAVKDSAKIGAQAVELHTGTYAEMRDPQGAEAALDDLTTAAIAAEKMGLFVAAGHGLHYHNVQPVAAINEIEELNIGHSIISRAAFVGLSHAVEEMRYLIDR